MQIGLNDTLYDSGAALSDGRRVLFAANEERYSRRKNEGGFPRRALEALFRSAGLRPRDVRRICVAGIMNPPLPARLFPSLHAWGTAWKRGAPASLSKSLMDYVTQSTPLCSSPPDSALGRLTRPFLRAVFRRRLPPELRGVPIHFVEHHAAHLAEAWRLSGMGESLGITCDGMGDGLSLTVSRCSPAGVRRLWSLPARVSYGAFYEMVTEALGFVALQEEGKVTGLAAFGKASRVDERFPFSLRGGRAVYEGPYGLDGVRWIRERLLSRHRAEDVAAWAQSHLEDHLVRIAKHWLVKTGLKRLVLSGGVFANVKLNQRLNALDQVAEIHVAPNMGDSGLSLGALCALDGVRPQRLRDVFLGDSFTEREMEDSLRAAGLAFSRPRDADGAAAEELVQGKVVARFQGRMEWGPRALGNRSVLADPSDGAVARRLNKMLKRNDFMPFAPAVLEEDADVFFRGLNGARHAAEFMTVCADCTPRMKREYPAAVHVDGTARPQVVSRASNPSFHGLLRYYRRITGRPVLLNTSFNLHGEPIVRTPREAVASFLAAGLDCLVMGPFLARAWRPGGKGKK